MVSTLPRRPTVQPRRAARAALAVLPSETLAYTLAVTVGWLFAARTVHFLTAGPFLLGTGLTLLVLTPLRRRVLTPVRAWLRETDGPPLVTRLRDGPGQGWWRREASLALLGLWCWLALATAVLGVVTARRYLTLTEGSLETLHPSLTLLIVGLTGLAASVFVTAIGEIAPPRASLVTLARIPRTAPRPLAERLPPVAIRSLLVGGTAVVTFHMVALGEYPFAVFPSLPVTVATIALPLFGLRWLTAAVGKGLPSPPETVELPLPLGRVALAVLLVCAPLAGVTAVRVTDAGYAGADPQPLPDEPNAMLVTAVENTYDTSYRRVTRSKGDGEVREVLGVDRADRQYRVDTDRRDAGHNQFHGEGVLANNGDGSGFVEDGEILRWTKKGWRANAQLPGAFVFEGVNHDRDAPSGGVGWRVIGRSGDTVTLGIDGPAVGQVIPFVPSPAAPGKTVAGNATARVVIDRERRTLVSVRVNATVHRTDDDRESRQVRWTRRFEAVGDHDVSRPEAIGPRHPVEWLWDLAYY